MVISPEKHSNACEVIDSVKENMNLGIAMEHTGSFSCDAEIQVQFRSVEKGVQAHQVWRPSTKNSLVN